MADLAVIRDIIGLGVFLSLVGVGFAAVRPVSPGVAPSRRRISGFLILVLSVSLVIGLAQRASLFPFHMWTLLGSRAPVTAVQVQLVAVDGNGREHPIDYRAWQPFSFWELKNWYQSRLMSLDSAARQRVGGYLLGRAEAARASARTGGRIGTHDRWLGPLALPLFTTYRPIWSDPSAVPVEPFVALRWYRTRWDVMERAQDADAYSRTLVFQYSAP